MSKIKMNYFINTTLKKRWICGVAVVLLSTAGQSAIAANWYVDSAVGTSGNGQSWASAFKDFSNISWSAIKPGDTLYISGGSTSKAYKSTLKIGADGTSSSRITIRAGQDAGHNGKVILDGGGISIAYADYVTIDGSVGTTSQIQIQNVTSSNKDWGWAIDGAGTGPVGVTVRYVTITNCNNGINLTYGDTYEIDHNSITIKGDAGIRGYANPSHGFGWNKIHDNAITSLSNNGYGGPDSIQTGGSTDVYNNQFFAVSSTAALQGQHPDTLQAGGSRYLRVYGNTFNDVADSNIDIDAFGSGVIQDVYIYNNLFHIAKKLDDYPDFIRMYSTGKSINTFSNVKILNNTFIVDSGQLSGGIGQIMGFGWANGSGAGTGNEIKNNLAMGTGKMGFNRDKTGGGSWTVSWGNNIYPTSQTFDPSATIGVPSLDASFVPTSSDTLARDKGTSLLNYFSTDKVGTVRPQGSAFDIGAFEYSGNSSVILSPPKNLRIQ
jgi:hypothetical protein